MNTASIWEEARVAALLGTGRQPYAASQAEQAIGEMLARLRERTPEERLLGTAAAIDLFEQAGRIPSIDTSEAPAEAPAEALASCPEAFAARLALILAGTHRELLSEALDLLVSLKRRVPEMLLPELLALGREQRNLRDKVVDVIGERGRWLAALNPDWSYAAQPSAQGRLFDPAALAETWQTADKAARVAILSELRMQDPGLAREMIAKSFSAEGAEDRARFLAVLGQGLGQADEPILSQALGDRSKDVRRVAAELLARLPGSEYALRMAERARGMVRLRRKFLGQVLEVELPEKFDPAWQRDAIEEKPPSSKIGEKAWWLAQIVGMAAPSVWKSHLGGESPERLVTLAAGTDWADALLLGWGKASRLHADPAWAEPVARIWTRRPDRAAFPREMIPTSADLGPGAEGLIRHFLREAGEPLHDQHPALWLLSDYEQPWSEALARTVVESIKARVAAGAGKDRHVWQLQQSLRRFALYMPHQVAGELSEGWPEDPNPYYNWQSPIEDFAAKLQFRQDLHKEITP